MMTILGCHSVNRCPSSLPLPQRQFHVHGHLEEKGVQTASAAHPLALAAIAAFVTFLVAGALFSSYGATLLAGGIIFVAILLIATSRNPQSRFPYVYVPDPRQDRPWFRPWFGPWFGPSAPPPPAPGTHATVGGRHHGHRPTQQPPVSSPSPSWSFWSSPGSDHATVGGRTASHQLASRPPSSSGSHATVGGRAHGDAPPPPATRWFWERNPPATPTTGSHATVGGRKRPDGGS